MGFTDEELTFLREHEEGRQYRQLRWTASENIRPRLEELIDRGLMQWASGEFKLRKREGETVNVLGRAIPLEGDMIGRVMLTRLGQQLYEVTQ